MPNFATAPVRCDLLPPPLDTSGIIESSGDKNAQLTNMPLRPLFLTLQMTIVKVGSKRPVCWGNWGDCYNKNYDTQIGKWIDPDGINLSGGKLQRMTISRAAYRGGLIYILDEPTAALDPMAEYDIYSTFNEMISDKCAIFITHRLSAVQLADKIAVFDDGHVAEYGTHSELYVKGGIYTDMFDKQARFYRDGITGSSNTEQ